MRAADGGRAVERLGFFSDAVYAVALVLLVVHLPLPLAGVPSGALHDALGDAAPELVGFGIGFAMIGALWVDHHRLFDCLRARDEALLWANLALLLCVAFLPYPAVVFAKNTGAPVAVLFFAGSLLVTALVSAALSWYASGIPRLVGDVDRTTRRRLVRRPLLMAAVLVISAPLAAVGFTIGEFQETLAPLVWIAGLVAARTWLIRSAPPEPNGP
jgi:uncharacterized membrane protein